MKLLESVTTIDNNVAQQVEDGALINFQAADQRSGLIWGCEITTSANKVYIDSGLLMIRGYRIKITQRELLYDFTSVPFPSSNQTKYICIRITRTGHDATYSIIIMDPSEAYGGSRIERIEGSYTYRLVKVELDYNGIKNTTSVISTITPGGSTSGGSTGVSVTVPEPQLEIVGDTKESLTNAWLCLANKGDYSKFISQYTVKFEMYRYVSKGQYRKRSGTQKLYIYKTGYVQPLIQNGSVQLGWQVDGVEFKTVFTYNDLKEVVVTEKQSYSYTRKNVIEGIYKYVNGMFYEKTPDGPALITVNSNVFSIRSTRSKTTSPYDWLKLGDAVRIAKHNFFRFAFKAVVYDQNNKKVAESGLSRAVLIRPNLEFRSDQSPGKIGKFFRITII